MFLRGFFWAAGSGAIGGIITVMFLNAALWHLEETEASVEECASHPLACEKGFCLAAVCGALGGVLTVLCMSAVWRAEEAQTGIKWAPVENPFEESQKQAQEHDERDP